MTDVYGTEKNVIIELSRDDLTEVKGIGTTTAEKLYNAKIISIQQIADMTPERLSETPGIGLATATKFIAAAKNCLENSPKIEVIEEPIEIPQETKVEPTIPTIEQYEVEEVIVDEIKQIEEVGEIKEQIKEDSDIETEIEESIKSSQTQKKWFGDKYNYSRLTASYPSISERAKNNRDTTEAEVQEDQVKEQLQENQIEKEINVITTPEVEEPQELESTVVTTQEKSVHQQINEVLKDVGCYEIPNVLTSLKRFTSSLDYLGCKLVEASKDLKILLLFPVKCINKEGTVLVNETKLELKDYSKKNDLMENYDVERVSNNLLSVRDSMYEDIANRKSVLSFFQKYLQISLSLEKGLVKNSAVFLSGSTLYKVYIEPILVCSSSPRSMEKSLAFPYQRSTNLHVVSRDDLIPLVRFVEKKYRVIENRTKKSSSIVDYKKAEETFRSSVKFASIPIFGYSVTLLVIFFAELYFLLRLFNTIGLAVVGIYLSLLAFFYFRAHKTKKQFTDQFETPYYMQNLEFSETDLLDIKEDLTDKLLTQFGYECLGKDAKFGVLEQSETNSLKRSVEVKQVKSEYQKMFEPQKEKEKTDTKSTSKYGAKYSSFVGDN